MTNRRLPQLNILNLHWFKATRQADSFDGKSPILKVAYRILGLAAISFILYPLSSIFYPTSAQAAASQFINIQGKVTNSNGTNVADGAYDFVFKLYDGAGSSATNTFTETWSNAALWSSTMSAAPSAGGTSLTYSSNTNESTIKVGQFLWNTTKQEPVKVVAVNTGTNVITISATAQAWATGDTVTNRIYVKDGIFQASLNSLNANWGTTNFNQADIHLGINFNSDGEMKPRSQLNSVPYSYRADSAASVDGLSIAGGKTVTFSNSLTFNGTDSTTFTLPSSTDTLVGLAASQALTNKTINGLTITSSTGTLTVGNGLVLAVSTASKTLTGAGTQISIGGNFTTSGAFATTLTATGTTTLTLPTTGTLATLAGAEALTNKTVNGLTISSSTGTLTVTNGKTLSASNTLTFTGTDGSTVAFGTGGTVCYTSSSCVTADSLDFSHLADSMTLDANTSIALAGFTLSTSGSGSVSFGHTGTTNFAGGLTFNSSPLNLELSRNLPIVVNDYVEVGSFNITAGAHDVRISVVVSDSGFSTAKQYIIPVAYNATANAWHKVLPLTDSGAYGSNNFELNVNSNNAVTTFRLLRTGGSTVGTARIRIESVGYTADAFSSLTGTGTDTSPSTIFASTSLTQVGSKVGILNAAPSATLDVTGTAAISSGLTAGTVTSTGLLTASNGFTLTTGTLSLPASSVTDAMVSDTLTSSLFVGSGSTTTAVDLATAEVAGTLSIARGGTNSTATPTNGGIAYGTGSAFAFSAAGTSGQCLQSNGAAAPTWGACSSGSLTGSGTSGQVSFWNGTSTQTGSNNLFWDNGNARLGVGTNSPAEALHVVGNIRATGSTIQLSNLYPEYNWSWGGSTDLNWKTIATVTIATGAYRGAAFQVDITDTQGNFGNTSNVKPMQYFVSMVRSSAVADDTDNATVSGPVADYVRVVKTSIGNYELQVRQISNYRHMSVKARIVSELTTTVAYVTSPANGSTGPDVYTATTTHTDTLTNALVAGNLQVSGTISGNGSSVTSLNGTNISSGTVANARLVNSGALTVTAGTGLSGGGSVALGSSTTLNLANTAVTLGSYGSASNVATFTVDAQGRLTAAASTAIAIAGSQITSGQVAIAQGGTNSTATPTNGGIAYGTGSAYAFTSAGSSGQCLQSNGAAAPTWGTCFAITADSLNFSDFADAMSLDASTSIATAHNMGLSVTSSLTGGARSTAAFSVSQANDVTNNFTNSLVDFSNSDTASSGSVLSLTNAGTGLGLSVSINPSSTNTAIEANRFSRTTTGTAAAGLGLYDSYWGESANGSALELGRIQYDAHIVDDGLAGNATTNNASRLRFYVEREMWDDMIPVFGAYATGGDRLLCMNGIENSSTANWDCFGMTIGSANAVTFSFDGSNRGYAAYDSNVFTYGAYSGNALRLMTLGGQNITFDTNNNGDDMTISSTGAVGVTAGLTAGTVTSTGLLTASNGFTLTTGTLSLPSNSVTDAMVSNTLTSSIFIGSGSTTNAVDLATAEVSGTLANSNLTGSGALTVTAGNGLTGGGSVALGSSTSLQVGAGTGISVGSTTVGLDYSATLAGNPALTTGQSVHSTTGIIFEGTTADTNELLITVTDPTADRTITLPNASGTVAISASGNIALDAAGNLTLTGTISNSNLTGSGALTVTAGNGLTGGGSVALGSSTSLQVGAGTGISVGATTVGLDYSATLAGNPALAANGSSFASTGLIFEGSSADTIETLLTVANPTGSDNTITLPDASGTVAVSASGNIALSAAGAISFTGTLPIANGGTNSTATPTNGGIAYGTGSAYAFSAAGTSGQCLQSNGAAAPTWGTCFAITADSLNFSDFADAMSTDAATSINVTSGGLSLAVTGAPTSDMMSIANTTGSTTAGVNNLALSFVGGAAAVEGGSVRVDLTPGSTTGGTWNGYRFVANATGPATGVTENGLKVEGPTTGGAGTFNGVRISNLAVTTAGTASGIDITPTNSQAAGTVNGININNLTAGGATETAVKVGSGWDSVVTVNGTSILNGSGVLQSAGLSGAYSNQLTLSNTSNVYAGTTFNGLTITNNGTNTLNVGAGLTLAVTTASKTLTGAGTSLSIGNNLTLSGTTGSIILGSSTHNLTLTTIATSAITLPTTGTLATIDGSEMLTNKSVNGLTISSTTGTLTIASGKTLTISNTLRFQGTDGTIFTLPGATDTLVGLAASQILTNKTLSSAVLSGTVTMSGLTTNGGILYTNGSGVVAQTSAGTEGQCLESNGGGAPVWGDCDSVRHSVYKAVNVDPGATTFSTVGMIAPVIAANSTASSDDADGSWITLNTNTTSGTSAAIRPDPVVATTARPDWNPDAEFVVKTPATISSIRLWAGMFSDNPMGFSTLSSISGAGFRFHTDVGDTTWQCYNNDGVSTGAGSNSGVTVTANTKYVLRIKIVGGTRVVYYLNGTEVCNNTTQLPATTSMLGIYTGVRTATAASRSWLFSRITVVHD